MKTITDKEIYLIEEIDLYIQLLHKVHSEDIPKHTAERKETQLDRAIWYVEYLLERSE